MKIALGKYFLAGALLLCSIASFAQGQMYTRKARLEDFPTRTTKVVIDGTSFLEMSFREEITTRWRISPYEFCTHEEYEAMKTDNGYYFINLGAEEGIMFLIMSKGGRPDETDNLRKPFEVVRIPIASIGDPTGRELMFMGVFIDMLQAFIEDAMVSDQAAYSGLSWYNSRKLDGKRIYLDPDTVDDLYMSGEPNALLGITIAPTEISFGSFCYKILVSADTHELYFFKKRKYRGSRDSMFTESEIKQFDRRNGIIAR